MFYEVSFDKGSFKANGTNMKWRTETAYHNNVTNSFVNKFVINIIYL